MPQQPIAPVFKTVCIAGLLAMVGLVDLATGFEVSAFPLYALPIGLAVLWFGAPAGRATAFASAIVWFLADVGAGHPYTSSWIQWINAGSRLLFFLLVAFAVNHALRNRRRPRPQATSMPCPLLALCTDCGKVRGDDGYWWDIAAYARQFRETMMHAKLCPDCARKLYALAGDLPPSASR